MNIRITFIALGLVLFIFGNSVAEMTGRQIMEKQEELHTANTEVAEKIMILANMDGEAKEKRLLKRWSKEYEDGASKYLLVFTDPADIRGTALLTWENIGAENDQWLYLPAQKRMRRIAQGSKKNYFMGTDFTYEDMDPEDLDSFEYKVLRSEKEQGRDAWVVEAVPATREKARESGYSKRLMWIDKENFITLKIEFYDRREELAKTQVNAKFENVGGTVWRPMAEQMNNFKEEHKTAVGVKSMEIDIPLDDEVFTERFILTGKHLR